MKFRFVVFKKDGSKMIPLAGFNSVSGACQYWCGFHLSGATDLFVVDTVNDDTIDAWGYVTKMGRIRI